MCELFGISCENRIKVNEYLKEFFQRSDKHPNGWGLATFSDGNVSIEKEPVQASKSHYLKERLRYPISEKCMLAHIRQATIGVMSYVNTHPFTLNDDSGRRWTLIHNGTIFNYPQLNTYLYTQNGATDSERILIHLVELINVERKRRKHDLNAAERFEILQKEIGFMSKGNKLNLLFFDGEYMYAHCNFKDSLYVLEKPGTAIFCTQPVGNDSWETVPFTSLLAYKDGIQIFQSAPHGNEYIENPEDYKYLYLPFSSL